MNPMMIEAIFLRDLERAKETHAALVEAAEKQRAKLLDECREEERAAYREEQEFFFQG